MKNKLIKYTTPGPALALSAFCYNTFASGSIMGQVTDPQTKEAVAGATVVLDCQGSQKEYFTDDHGYYYASNIPACDYTLTVVYLDKHITLAHVQLADDEVRKVDIAISSTVSLTEAPIVAERYPLIDALDPAPIGTITRETFKNEPHLKVSDLALEAGIAEINGEFYSHGARAGSISYYIDDCHVMLADIPLVGLDTYRAYTGFIPAKYGETTGGVVVMHTRNYFSESSFRNALPDLQ